MPYDPTHGSLRRLFEELWDPRSVSNGAVRPSRDRMEARQRLRWPDDPGVWSPSPADRSSVDEICTRFKHRLRKPLDPRFSLEEVVHPIAEFLVAFDGIEPFGTQGHKGLVGTSLHDCCKFAGCPPPPEMESGPSWREILFDRGSSDGSRVRELTDLFYDGIGAEISGRFAASMETGRVKAHRARKRRRAAVARKVVELRLF